MKTILIIGASRGLGFELARQYREAGDRVIATARREEHLLLLTALGCEIIKLDVTNLIECSTLAWKLDGEEINLAILNSGLYAPSTENLSTPSQAEFDIVMHTNVLAALRILPTIAPLVVPTCGTLAVMSSAMGSISERSNNYAWLYRASKAALNSVLCDLALSYGPKGINCLALHPGWVKTEMGGKNADLEICDAITRLRQTLNTIPKSEQARFIRYDGEILSW